MQQSDVYSAIAEVHADHPQRAQLAKLALDDIYMSINELAKLGHVIVLSFTELPAPIEFPKMLYHATLAPLGQVFENAIEVADAGDGWSDRPIVPTTEPTVEPSAEPEPEAPTPPVVTVSVESPTVPDNEAQAGAPVEAAAGGAPGEAAAGGAPV